MVKSLRMHRKIKNCRKMNTHFLLDQMLQGHLARFTTLILMEECIIKSCYVKLEKMPNEYSARYSNKRITFIDTRKCKKSERQYKKKNLIPSFPESRIANQDRNQCINSGISKASNRQRKTNVLAFSRIGRIVSQNLSDFSENMSRDHLSTRKQNDSLKPIIQAPIVIPFSIQRRKENRTNMLHIIQTIAKSLTEKQSKGQNGGATRVSLSEYRNKTYSVDFKITHSSTAQTLPCQHQNEKNDSSKISSLSSRDVEQDNVTFKNKILLRKWKEKWYVKMRSSYYSTEPSLHLISDNDKTDKFVKPSSQSYSTDSRNESKGACCTFPPITDQEMNDGLPDI